MIKAMDGYDAADAAVGQWKIETVALDKGYLMGTLPESG
jgi:hypothetical protein